MGRKKLYTTDEERKAARAKSDEKYYLRNRKKILKKQHKRYIERQLDRNAQASSSKRTLNVAPQPVLNSHSANTPRRLSGPARQVRVIDAHVVEWRNLIGVSAKEYCASLYTLALTMNGETAFRYLSDAHNTLDNVQSKIGTALNNILETSGTSCKEYREGLDKLEPVKQCVRAVFDLWEAAAEDDEEEYPGALQTTFARRGFSFQQWETT